MLILCNYFTADNRGCGFTLSLFDWQLTLMVFEDSLKLVFVSHVLRTSAQQTKKGVVTPQKT